MQRNCNTCVSIKRGKGEKDVYVVQCISVHRGLCCKHEVMSVWIETFSRFSSCSLQRLDVLPFIVIYGLWAYFELLATFSSSPSDSKAGKASSLVGLVLVALHVGRSCPSVLAELRLKFIKKTKMHNIKFKI